MLAQPAQLTRSVSRFLLANIDMGRIVLEPFLVRRSSFLVRCAVPGAASDVRCCVSGAALCQWCGAASVERCRVQPSRSVQRSVRYS